MKPEAARRRRKRSGGPSSLGGELGENYLCKFVQVDRGRMATQDFRAFIEM
jgi:hypothetical protein